MFRNDLKKKSKIGIFLVILLIISLGFKVFNNKLIEYSKEEYNGGNIPRLADATFTKEWIKNGNFSSGEYWEFTEGVLGDPEDLNATISDGEAKFKVLGDKGIFSLIADPPNETEWMNFTNPELPILPDNCTFDQNGIKIEHKWDGPTEQLENNPSIHFKQNITMLINMSDFIITSASIQTRVNATVTVSPINGGIEREGDSLQYLIGDYIRFYVLISDVKNINSYPIAEYITTNLGQDGPPAIDKLNDTYLISVPEEILISYFTSILKTDNYNFTITLGIDIYCENNLGGNDRDYWDEIRINYFKLNFTYVKKIDQFTSMTCNQEGDKPSEISNNTIVVNDAILNFKYKINDTWPSTAPNSEIRILINKIPHSETVKLSNAFTIFQDAKSGGFKVKSLIDEDKDVNVSIQVYLTDEFELNRTIEISIDDVSLNITYTEIVADKPTNLQLFLNRENKTIDPVIELPFGENLNITVKYTNQTEEHISGALVQLEGKVNDILYENITFQHYSTIINTSNLGIGITILKVIAQKAYYQTREIQFYLDVTERDTELQLFLNGNPKNEGETLKVELDEFINVTVNYKDNETKNHLPNATVNLLGIDKLNETDERYTILINANNLDNKINTLTIFAYLFNYKSQSIRFFIEVVERSSQIQLFLNNEEKTLDPNIEFPIGTTLDITVKYKDNKTGLHISNATLQLIGEGLLIELSENISLGQYQLELNETNLKIGVNLFTILAQATNYQTKTIYSRIIVKRRNTLINISSPILAETGDDVSIELTLTDLDFGGTIKNATVTYQWAYGQAEFKDLDNNGIYDVVLENVPLGTFTITISAFAGDEYDFESKDITLIVSNPEAKPGLNWGWLIFLLIGAIIGLVTIFSLYQMHFKYPPIVRKIRKVRKKIKKDKSQKPLILKKREDIIDNSLQDYLKVLESNEIKTAKVKTFKNIKKTNNIKE